MCGEWVEWARSLPAAAVAGCFSGVVMVMGGAARLRGDSKRPQAARARTSAQGASAALRCALAGRVCMYVCVFIYMYVCTKVHTYIYIYYICMPSIGHWALDHMYECVYVYMHEPARAGQQRNRRGDRDRGESEKESATATK